ncbi:hypothetical protein F5148DRAFT_1155063 [Russula earlei]|uniref:Uncharacterized protein n=1 Tax=Russula earlei TaxID=71964 RepID=A0ACC0TRU7_9AGAM|nr:hypothetical protein F5148DRAFT_1155063 [Russula earlei]
MANAPNGVETDGIETSDTTSSFDGIHAPVGLSDPQYSARKRKMLDAVIRLRAIGSRYTRHRGPWITERWQVLTNRSNLGHHTPKSVRHLHQVPNRMPIVLLLRAMALRGPLRLVTDEDGTVLGQPRRVEFGDPIFDKHLVTERIRRAQSAILNPATPPTTFLNESTDDLEERQLSFSSNSVCLEIRGRDIDDLSFVDLPADYENQGAHRLAAQYDPHGSRTIGVLTKPDRIPTGEEGSWIMMIQGQHDIDGEETGIEYFLREESRLTRHQAWLPELEGEVNKQLDRTNNEISRLPSPPSSEPVGEMLRLIGLFVRSIERLVEDEEIKWQEETKNSKKAVYIEDVMLSAKLKTFYRRLRERMGCTLEGSSSTPTVKELNKRIKAQIEGYFAQYTHGHLKSRVSYGFYASCLTSFINMCKCDRATYQLSTGGRARAVHHERAPFHGTSLRVPRILQGNSPKDEGSFVEHLQSKDANTKSIVNKVISGLAELGLHSMESSSLARLLPPDPMETAIEIMSEVQAYFQVSYRRFVDNVPMTIDRTLLRGLKVGLESALFTGMDISGPGGYERCKLLLSEPEHIVMRRAELQNKRDRLGRAKEELLHAFE